ncbi:hypothetical protein SMICM304S_07462 [Streptomyces microflavus]
MRALGRGLAHPRPAHPLLAVASITTGIARLLADDPGTAILHGLVARMCATLDHATRPDTPGLATQFEHAL